MKYKDIVSQVRTAKSRGVASQSNRLSARYIISVALRKRSRVLKQEREKKKLKEKFLKQSLCMELIEVDKHECECVVVNGCKVLRTKKKVPKLIKESLDQVLTIDGSLEFSPTSFNDYKKYARLKTSNPKYYIMNEYVYVSGKPNLQWIKVIGIFYDPVEIEKQSCSSSNSDLSGCFNALETDFKINAELEDYVMVLTMEEIFKSWNLGNQDVINNQNGET